MQRTVPPALPTQRHLELDQVALATARSRVPIHSLTSLKYPTSSKSGAMLQGIYPNTRNLKLLSLTYFLSRYYVETFESFTPQQCAQLCLEDAGCLSFDAGVPYLPGYGNCFLSYDNRLTNNASQFTGSLQLDYYERVVPGLSFCS